MPNIEIHGLLIDDAKKFRQYVFTAFRNESFLREMVVTIFPTEVKDCDDRDQPFFRVFNSHSEDDEKIITILHETFHMDIEYPPPGKFVPK